MDLIFDEKWRMLVCVRAERMLSGYLFREQEPFSRPPALPIRRSAAVFEGLDQIRENTQVKVEKIYESSQEAPELSIPTVRNTQVKAEESSQSTKIKFHSIVGVRSFNGLGKIIDVLQLSEDFGTPKEPLERNGKAVADSNWTYEDYAKFKQELGRDIKDFVVKKNPSLKGERVELALIKDNMKPFMRSFVKLVKFNEEWAVRKKESDSDNEEITDLELTDSFSSLSSDSLGEAEFAQGFRKFSKEDLEKYPKDQSVSSEDDEVTEAEVSSF